MSNSLFVLGSCLAEAMAKPTESQKSLRLFHGTDEKHAQQILADGYLKGRETQGRSRLAPTAGYVYVTKDVMYAVGYAGAFSRWGQGCSKKRLDGTEKFLGYVFVVDASVSTDMISDEDLLGGY